MGVIIPISGGCSEEKMSSLMRKSFIGYKRCHGDIAVIVASISNIVKLFNNTFNVYLLSRQARFLHQGTDFYQSSEKQVSNNKWTMVSRVVFYSRIEIRSWVP